MKGFKNRIAAHLPTVFVLLTFFAFTASCVKKEAEEIRIGAILPLTGSAALLGEETKKGMEIAIDDVNRAGGLSGRKVRVIFTDSRNNPTEGVSAFTKLIEKDKVPIVVSEMSSVTRALIPIADGKQVVLFATVTAAPQLTESSEWVFRYYYTTDIQGRVLAGFITQRLNLTDIAVLHLDDEYGTSSFEFARVALEQFGGHVVSAASFDASSTEVRSQLLKLMQSKPEGILIIAYDRSLAMAFRQAKEMGIRIPLFTYTGLADPSVLELAGNAAEGTYLTVGEYNPANPSTEIQARFVNNYKKRYDALPGHYPAFGYDVLSCIVEAIKRQGYNSESIRTGLLSIQDFPLVMGSINIAPNREVLFPQVVRRIQDGQVSPVE